jgi:predicted nuclease with TOPRIM domain
MFGSYFESKNDNEIKKDKPSLILENCDSNYLIVNERDNESKELVEKFKIIEPRLLYLDDKIKSMDFRLIQLDEKIKSLENENLRLHNLMLEKELELERNKNALLRHNIPFQFTPSFTNKKKL